MRITLEGLHAELDLEGLGWGWGGTGGEKSQGQIVCMHVERIFWCRLNAAVCNQITSAIFHDLPDSLLLP